MENPAVRWFVNLFDTVAIRRDQPREAIRIVLEGLRKGDVMCLFAEGQLTRTGNLCPLQRGCEVIARRSGAPVLPLWIDGSWGSVFSFERGRFFRKIPYRTIRWNIRAAFGPPLDSGSLRLADLRQALGRAAAQAQATRFQKAAWTRREPASGAAVRSELTPESRRRLWHNGYQVGQINALRRRRSFQVLASEWNAGVIPAGIAAFAGFYKAPPHAETGPPRDGCWVGGRELRATLENNPPAAAGVVFYDFSARATEPLAAPGVVHCPCLALEGTVIAMSMPDPPTGPGQDPQIGGKPGCWGLPLPGWSIAVREDGRLLAHGPAAPPEGLLLPPGAALDEDGWLFPGPQEARKTD